MSNRTGFSTALAVGLLAIAAPLAAHHGAGVFEATKTVTIEGTVTDFQFVNPHVLVYMAVRSEGGKEVTWGGELTSPNRLARMDGKVKWHQTILKPGDRITMTGHPARNGAPAMDITKIVDGAGTVLIDDNG
jgi:hypothetical protein